MVEFRNQDLSGSVFDDVDLTGARFINVLLRDVTIRGAWAERLSIDGGFEEVLLNGIDVVPLWRAELTRQHPEFALLEPDRPDGYRTIWPVLEEQWVVTVARARRLPEELLHERVEGEWSFIQTLRHMLLVHDAWLRRAVLGEPAPFDPLDLPHDEMPDLDGVPNDPDARPSLAEVLVLREERLAVARRFFAEHDRRAARRRDHGDRAGLSRGRHLLRDPVPARRARRGVVAPPLRRARPQCARGALSGRVEADDGHANEAKSSSPAGTAVLLTSA